MKKAARMKAVKKPARPTKGTAPVSPREKLPPYLRTYAGQVSARLRAEREKRWTSVQAFAEHIKTSQGVTIHWRTLYSYEQGKAHGGADVPIGLIPVFSRAFGHKTPGGWLPPYDPPPQK